MFGKKLPLLLAGVAAYAYYKYSKMSKTEKDELIGNLKNQGKKFYDQYMPAEGKKAFKNPENTMQQF